MAVSIDTVYQRVLSIANKEQRAYITPQEFNLLANQAQMEIFEQYFYDINQFNRAPNNDTTYSDMIDLLNEKIDIFEKYNATVTMTTGGVGTLPDYYRMGELYYKDSSDCNIEIELISQNKINNILNSRLTHPTVDRPVYVRNSGTTKQDRERKIQVYPTTITSDVVCNYIARPAEVKWGYVIVNDQALYDNSTSATTDFELHQSEETKLVIKILELAGVVIKKPDLYQVGDKEETETVQQEKQ